jgi:hypothetical protein
MQFTTTLLLGGKTATGIRVPDRYLAGTASGGHGAPSWNCPAHVGASARVPRISGRHYWETG